MTDLEHFVSETRPIDLLVLNDKNPRGIKDEDFARLRKQIEKLGMYKPVIIDQDNKVLGGNMRVRVYREMGIQTVWVSVVDTTTENKEVDYVLSDNDRAGYWEENDLAELLSGAEGLDMELYKLDTGSTEDLSTFLDRVSGNGGKEEIEDENSTSEFTPETKEVTCPNCGHTFKPE